MINNLFSHLLLLI